MNKFQFGPTLLGTLFAVSHLGAAHTETHQHGHSQLNHSQLNRVPAVEQPALPKYIIEVPVTTKYQRSAIADLGYAIEEYRSDKVFIFGNDADLKKIRDAGFDPAAQPTEARWFEQDPLQKGGGNTYHDYEDVMRELNAIVSARPDIASLSRIGYSLEGREIPLLRLSQLSPAEAQNKRTPAVIFMGCHHAREHLSVEIPLRYAKYMVENASQNPTFQRFLAEREIFIAPVINPDGHIHDRSGGRNKMWRKNRRASNGRVHGVDLNRNYGYMWGTGGSSSSPSSDVYMGPEPFSEPESQAVRDFVRANPRATVLVSFHTFSELILYPWGHKYDPVEKPLDRKIYETMAQTMAQWNGYTPQQSSELYIASGDTTDWSYGELGIFSFTFELSPKSMWQGGFYPGDQAIQPTFQANIRPMSYLIEFADNPQRVLSEKVPRYDDTPAQLGIGVADFRDLSL